MSVGPVEPGEGTHARDAYEESGPPLVEPPRGPLARWYGRHRRAARTAAAAAVLLALGGYAVATRPEPPAPAPPPELPYPSQVFTMVYLGRGTAPANAPRGSFSFRMELSTSEGPPVTVTRITQPYTGLSLTSVPPVPIRTRRGIPRKVVVTMRATECAKVPENAELPFLDVTLRNTRAMQVHSYILGHRYAQDLSRALKAACHHGPS